MESQGVAIQYFLALYIISRVTVTSYECLNYMYPEHKRKNAIISLSLQLPKEMLMKIVKFAAKGRKTVYLFHVREQFRTFPWFNINIT